MRKFRIHSHLDDGLFVVLIMVASVAAAALEAGALIGAFPEGESATVAVATPSPTVRSAEASAPAASVQLASRGSNGTRLSR